MPARRPIRWWPAVVILVISAVIILTLRWREDSTFQEKNLRTAGVVAGTLGALLLWWLLLSRARWKLRLGVAAAFLAFIGLMAASFRVRGVSGDLLPILEPRWVKAPAWPTAVETPSAQPAKPANRAAPNIPRRDFPQFLGPDRTAMISGMVLEVDWVAHPPEILWRQKIGPGWSGFVIAGERAITQEQRGEEEAVTCYDLTSGRLLWTHLDPAHYNTPIAGEGPRATPAIASNRVFALGSTGLLNCLDLATGERKWQRDLAKDANTKAPEWGFAGSPLVVEGKVIVSAGGKPGRSLLAYHVETGELAWGGGDAGASYGSPFIATLAGARQVLIFNSRRISAHDPNTGAVLWEYPWGNGYPAVSTPVILGPDRALFSSGYGVGAELLEIRREAEGKLVPHRVWQSKRLKSKFGSLAARDGFAYGLDDGMFACIDLKDGSQRWKEGRYGHGQGLWIGDMNLLMAENGELVLLQPTPEAPNERHRFRVFDSKTWNPLAITGDLLLARNDLEAVCLRLAVKR